MKISNYVVSVLLVVLAIVAPAFAFADGADVVEVANNYSIEQIGLVVTSLLVFLTQLAALLGKPIWVERLGAVGKAINGLLDLITGNYGKAKNKESEK
jgi:hypothetical protein